MPHISSLKIENFRALRHLELTDLQPLNVFLGPNGCGKSTIFDAFQFIAECLQTNVRKALESRGRFHEVRSRGAEGPISFEISFRESDLGARPSRRITYRLEIGERDGRPVVQSEICRWSRKPGKAGRPYHFVSMQNGAGEAIPGEAPEDEDRRVPVTMESPDVLAIKALGVLAENPKIAALRRFIEGWYLSYFVPDQARGVPPSGAEEHLSRTGANLANVMQYLSEDHPDTFEAILRKAAARIPGLERVEAQKTLDNRVALRFKDGPWEDPFLARHVSDGTLKMLAYLVLLNDPASPPLLGVEEPENGLHPKLLGVLAEEFRSHARGVSGRPTQVFVSSHSPYFVDALRPEELWVMDRGEDGYARAERTDRIGRVKHFLAEGGNLGSLWFENHFDGRGNPRAL